MRKIFFGFAILFGSLLIGSLSIQDASATQPPCFEPDLFDIKKQGYLLFSNTVISDWELIDIEINCGGMIDAKYKMPEFSSEETNYEVSVIISYEEFMLSTQVLEELLKNKNPIISNGISQLHSSEIFEELNEKLMIQTVSFDYRPTSTTITSPMKFSIIAQNQFGYESHLITEPIQDDFGFLRLTNDIDIESVGVHESRKQVDIFSTNTDSSCQIMSCTESSCGITTVDHRPNGQYTVIIQIEGELCPPSIRVSLDSDLKFLRIHPVDKYGQGIEWPPKTEESSNELSGQSLKVTDEITDVEAVCLVAILDTVVIGKVPSPRMQIFCDIEPEMIRCNEGLQLIFKSSDNSPVCVKPETAEKLIKRGWAF